MWQWLWNAESLTSQREQNIFEWILIFRFFFFSPLQVESVELALNVLDGSDVRGKTISVQRAEFQMRGEYNPALKPRMKKQEKEKMKKIQEKWVDGWKINIVCGCLDSEQFTLDEIQTNRYCWNIFIVSSANRFSFTLIRLFDWRPEKMRGERAKHERTVIIKNLFEPELFDREVHLLLEYQNDLREECAKCGTVRKVTVYDVSLL